MINLENQCYCQDIESFIPSVPDNSIDLIITSPPYAERRRSVYGGLNALVYPDWFFGLSENFMRVLKPSGSFVLNIKESVDKGKRQTYVLEYLLKMARRGWWTETFIWCLSGGTELYAEINGKITTSGTKDICKSFLSGQKIRLWNGEKWTRVMGVKKNNMPSTAKITLRSGQRICCTKEHVWPTERGNIATKNLKTKDVIKTTILPQYDSKERSYFDKYSIGWFVGIYLAEGSLSKFEKELQFSIHSREKHIFNKLNDISKEIEGLCSFYNAKNGNGATVKITGKIPMAIIRHFISGNTSRKKHLSNRCWMKSNEFLKGVIDGYLDGDGHYEKENNRWRIGFTRNYNLERSLRTICARLGYRIKLEPCKTKYKYNGIKMISDGFRGEIRKEFDRIRKVNYGEIVEISGCSMRDFWDIEVEDSPNLFALSSGVLTHNCKTNAFPTGNKKRLKDGFEYCYQFTKSKHYKFFPENCLIPANEKWLKDNLKRKNKGEHFVNNGSNMNMAIRTVSSMVRPSNVITLPTNTRNTGHPATFHPDLPKFFINLMTEKGDLVFDPFLGSGTTVLASIVAERKWLGVDREQSYIDMTMRGVKKFENNS